MTTKISLQGRVPVKNSAKGALGALVKILEPDADDVVRIDNDVLHIKIDGCDVPHGFHSTACKAVEAFCDRHASEGAVFDYDGAALVVGPGADAKRKAHVAHLSAQIKALTEELARIASAD